MVGSGGRISTHSAGAGTRHSAREDEVTMGKPHVSEREGTATMILDCPTCGWRGLVYYTTRRPVYCKDACKQKAYRQRRAKRNGDAVTKQRGRDKQQIERELDQTLHLLSCSCGRGIWTVRGNVQIGGLRCDLCDSEFTTPARP